MEKLSHGQVKASSIIYEPQIIEEAFMESNPVSQDFKTLEEMWAWLKPLIDVEEEWKSKQAKEEK
jgi:hypothetical protein